MAGRRSALRTAARWALLLDGAAIGGFGLITAIWPGGDAVGYARAVGLASLGMGLFGVMITDTAFRRGEGWAWWVLWYYPVFWAVHFLADLPPGKDHIHQVVFLVLSAAALVATNPWFTRSPEYVSRGRGRRPPG